MARDVVDVVYRRKGGKGGSLAGCREVSELVVQWDGYVGEICPGLAHRCEVPDMAYLELPDACTEVSMS